MHHSYKRFYTYVTNSFGQTVVRQLACNVIWERNPNKLRLGVRCPKSGKNDVEDNSSLSTFLVDWPLKGVAIQNEEVYLPKTPLESLNSLKVKLSLASMSS